MKKLMVCMMAIVLSLGAVLSCENWMVERLLGQKDEDDDGKVINGIRLTADSLVIGVGDVSVVKEIISPDEARGIKVEWSVDNKDIASVDEHGVVTGIAAGLTTVRAKAGETGARCSVLVYGLWEGAVWQSGIKEKFGVKSEGVAGVAETFSRLHIYLQSRQKQVGSIRDVIMLGDYIDLPFLHVAGYPDDDTTPGYGKIALDYADTTITNKNVLRLIVVGINSFNAQGEYGGSGNMEPGGPDPAMAHIVMQFLDLPLSSRRMNKERTSIGGYAMCEMRQYLVDYKRSGGNFSRGLEAAGVPVTTDSIWAPKRYVSAGGLDATAADLIEDKLWLPTDREMFGTYNNNSTSYETVANQARLEYYADSSLRVKKTTEGTASYYWNASPRSGQNINFCIISAGGSPTGSSEANVLTNGIAPAFCVR
ncbi:MAG: Ig-like domain-containing protein [Spirochaetaceae bacterium]|nr:Ig-like domain-containing protein [Spirochaetaceae bacterium]